jgi:phage-related protein
MSSLPRKPLSWFGNTQEIVSTFPIPVKKKIGYALHFSQVGKKHEDAKPLKGFHGAGTLEIVADYDGDTYRAIYTLLLKDQVYVLHAFQKKSKTGIKTPQADIDLIKTRLKTIIRS